MMDRFSNLANLYGAYFHEDFDLDYPSPDDVILSFAMHLDKSRRDRVLAELNDLATLPLEQQVKVIQDFGCRYPFLEEWQNSSVWISHIFTLIKQC